MSHKVFEDWYDLNSETNELLKLKMLKEEKDKKDCKICKKYIDYIAYLEKTVEQLKNTQKIIYIKDKNEQINRKTIL
jgi:hypothetical protein